MSIKQESHTLPKDPTVSNHISSKCQTILTSHHGFNHRTPQKQRTWHNSNYCRSCISKIKLILFHLLHLIPYLNLLFWVYVTFTGHVYLLQTYLLTDYWITVWKCLRASLGTPLCILFRLFLTYWHFLTLLGVCTVHGTVLTEGSTSTSTLDSCTVQETAMADRSASEALQTCVQYMEIPLVDGRHTIHSVLYMATPHRSYLYIR